jgi:NACHT domain/Trypsin-like peptidase domain
VTGPQAGRILLDLERAMRMADENADAFDGEHLRSAFAISRDHVLTAWHCVRDAVHTHEAMWFRLRETLTQGLPSYLYLPVAFIRAAEDLDVAVLAVVPRRLREAGLTEDEAASVLTEAAFPLGVGVPGGQSVRIKGFPGNAPSADSYTLPATVVDTDLLLGPVPAIMLAVPGFTAVDPVDPRGLSGGPVLLTRGAAETAVAIVRAVPRGRYPDTALGGGLVATQVRDLAENLPEVAAALDANVAAVPMRSEVLTYLGTLIKWLSSDPWPRVRGGPVLSPAVIERKLRITETRSDTGMAFSRERDVSADNLTDRCHRLIILGEPGSGKTWLAKRTARRCAEAALQAITDGADLDEVELPLYTTCSALYADAQTDVRDAAISSTLNQIGDLGGRRIIAALHDFFGERNAPVVLVIDSLDEAGIYQAEARARNLPDRLGQAENLPWRIVLTSRPSTWANQLTIDSKQDSDRIGELQPLHYPEDVEPFIRRWYVGQPEQGTALADQIAQRPDLQQSATVPLILAFYCLLGGAPPLPAFRYELYTQVLNRLLAGEWRAPDDRVNVLGCLKVLQAWAWEARSSDEVSGIGTWADDVLTLPIEVSPADERAINHVAGPVGLRDLDTYKTRRRFVHRSIREHFVARQIAALPAEEAAMQLLPHLWYDPDWEYAAPAAIAMHPYREELLRLLIRRAAPSDQFPVALSVIDAGWEFRRVLVRVAAESNETNWSPEIREMIAQARKDLVSTGHTEGLSGDITWKTANRYLRDALIDALSDTYGSSRKAYVRGIVRLSITAEDRDLVRAALIRLLAKTTNVFGGEAADLAWGISRLDPTDAERHMVFDTLFRLLIQHDAMDRAELLSALLRLDPAPEQRREILNILLADLSAPTTDMTSPGLLEGMDQFDLTAEDKRRICSAILEQLASRLGRLPGRRPPDLDTGILASKMVRFDPSDDERRRARNMLLRMLGHRSPGGRLEAVVHGIVALAASDEDKHATRHALLDLLTSHTSEAVAAALAHGVIGLDPTAEEKRRVLGVLLRLINRETSSWLAAQLCGPLDRLNPTTEQAGQVRGVLLGMLDAEADGTAAAELASALIRLNPTTEDKTRARVSLFRLQADTVTARLVDKTVRLSRKARTQRWTHYTLHGMLSPVTDVDVIRRLTSAVAGLDPTPEEQCKIRESLLDFLAVETDNEQATQLIDSLAEVSPTIRDLRSWPTWAAAPTSELLAAARRRSALADWLAALPALAPLSPPSRLRGDPG